MASCKVTDDEARVRSPIRVGARTAASAKLGRDVVERSETTVVSLALRRTGFAFAAIQYR